MPLARGSKIVSVSFELSENPPPRPRLTFKSAKPTTNHNSPPHMRTSRSTLTLLAAFAALGGFLGSANAQPVSVATTPVGAMTYSFPATATQGATAYISVPLTNSAVYVGPVASLTSTTISFSGTPFTSGSLAQVGSPFFARISSGAQAGRIMLITANTANSITVDVTDNSAQTTNLDTSGFALAVADKVEVIVGDTLAGLFGDNTAGSPLVFVGGSSVFTADAVGIYNRSTAKFDAYFFSTAQGFGYWRTSASAANANNTVIYPEAGLQIGRKTNRLATSLTILGDVPVISPLTKARGSASTAYNSTRFPTDVTLAQLSFSNWTRGTNTFTADTVGIYNPTTAKLDVYYQLAGGQWRKSTDSVTDQSGVVIPAGVGIAVSRRSTSLTGATSFISSTRPYTL